MTDQKVKPADKFNELLRKLFNQFKALPAQGLKSKLHLSELQSKMVNGMRAEPAYAVTFLGPYILRCGEDIKAGKSDLFLARDYDAEVMMLSQKHKFSYTDANAAIAFMKAAFKDAPAAQKAEIVATVQQLPGWAAQFFLNQKTKS